MPWPFSIYRALYPRERRVWVQVRILGETDRAVLVYYCRKVWIPKSRIYGIRLRKNVFEVYVGEGVVG